MKRNVKQKKCDTTKVTCTHYIRDTTKVDVHTLHKRVVLSLTLGEKYVYGTNLFPQNNGRKNIDFTDSYFNDKSVGF